MRECGDLLKQLSVGRTDEVDLLYLILMLKEARSVLLLTSVSPSPTRL